jgi:ribosome biogenesis protein BMS1
MADRYEVANGNATFYGYVRGCTYRLNDRVHFVGQGDYYIESMEEVLDPVEVGEKKSRSLKDSEKLVYAPMSSIGAL